MIYITLKILLTLFYAKSGIKKSLKIYDFYESIKAYNMLFLKSKFIVVLLVTLELLIVIFLLTSIDDIIYFMVGILLQSIYLYMQIKRIGVYNETTCNCFDISVPSTVTIQSITINLGVFVMLVTLYIVSLNV